MTKLSHLDTVYKKYMDDIAYWLPEGMIQVDIELLQRLNLLSEEKVSSEEALTRHFTVFETSERLTLVNDQFVIWIVPEVINDKALTYTLVALNRPKQPHLEIAFAASGVYNTSHLVLRVLEKLLLDIQENENVVKSLNVH